MLFLVLATCPLFCLLFIRSTRGIIQDIIHCLLCLGACRNDKRLILHQRPRPLFKIYQVEFRIGMSQTAQGTQITGSQFCYTGFQAIRIRTMLQHSRNRRAVKPRSMAGTMNELAWQDSLRTIKWEEIFPFPNMSLDQMKSLLRIIYKK